MTIAPGSNNPQDDLFEGKAQLERICRDIGRYSELSPDEQIKKCAEHAIEVKLFFESIDVLREAFGSDPLAKILKIFPSTKVILADAATMCGIGPRELWDNYVQPGKLPLYNSDESATDYLNATLLLEDVVGFYCEQELKRRCFSCQDIIKGLFNNEKLNDEDARRMVSALSSYFKRSSADAIAFESSMVICARYTLLCYQKHHSVPEKGNGTTVDSKESLTDTLHELLRRLKTEPNSIDAPPQQTAPKKKYNKQRNTIKEAAEVFGVSPSKINRWEADLSKAPPEYLGKDAEPVVLSRKGKAYQERMKNEREARKIANAPPGGFIDRDTPSVWGEED